VLCQWPGRPERRRTVGPLVREGGRARSRWGKL